MSASELARRVTIVLNEKRERSLEIASTIRWSPAMVSEVNGAVVAPPTIEDIAMRVIEANAYADAYKHAIRDVEEMYREMTAPDQGTEKTVPKQKRESPYQ